MKTIYAELLEHLIDTVENQYPDFDYKADKLENPDNYDGDDYQGDDDSIDAEDLHYHAFNEDYYILGCYQGEEWLKKHKISAFEAIEYVMEEQELNDGDISLTTSDINAERSANLYVYYKGLDIVANLHNGALVDLENTTKKELLEVIGGLGNE